MIIGVVAHDAGGAEVLSSWVVKNPGVYFFCLEGPAIPIFLRKIPTLTLESLKELVEKSEIVVTGSSATSNLELNAIALCRSCHKRSVTFIDHWINYRERFTRDQKVFLPDEIWVGDMLAHQLATSEFPNTNITLVVNPYFTDFLKEVSEIEKSKSNAYPSDITKLLFIGENIPKTSRKLKKESGIVQYSNLDSLSYLIENYSFIANLNAMIRVRAHPSESSTLYRSVIANVRNESLSIEISSHTLAEDLVWSDVVCGMSSMALALALKLGRRVICCMPGIDSKSKLPHEDIESLSKLATR